MHPAIGATPPVRPVPCFVDGAAILTGSLVDTRAIAQEKRSLLIVMSTTSLACMIYSNEPPPVAHNCLQTTGQCIRSTENRRLGAYDL